MKQVLAVALCLTAIVGCKTTPDAPMVDLGPVQPGPGESITLDRIIVLADVSGTMHFLHTFPREKALIESFTHAMPDGSYTSALNSFSGSDKDVWMRNELAAFSRPDMEAQAADLEIIGKSTTLGMALSDLMDDLVREEGRGAVLVFSDGRVDRDAARVLSEARMLDRLHSGPLCIYTVHMGTSTEGRDVMQQLAQVTGCGAAWTEADINSAAGMEKMIRTIFFEPAPIMPVRLDSDGDGVYDDEDQYPGTPKGARVDSRGCWVIENLQFDTAKSDIKPEFQGILDEVANVLKQNPGVNVRVDGHTDSDASDAYNEALSDRRANSVMAALQSRGIEAARMSARGFGESQPIVPNDSEANKYRNRRVEVTVVE